MKVGTNFPQSDIWTDLGAIRAFSQRPIPIWLGVGGRRIPRPPDVVLRRVGRLAGGWCLNIPTNQEGQAIVAKVHRYAKEAGRDPSQLPLEGRVRIGGRPRKTGPSR